MRLRDRIAGGDRNNMDVREAALRYLEHKMHTAMEVERRLKDKGFEAEEIEKTVDWLKEAGCVDDVSFGAEYLRYAFSKGRSINRAKLEMRDKGLSSDDIEKAIFAYEDEHEVDIMEEETKRAFARGEEIARREGSDEKTLAKMGRRLSSLGYSSGLIYKVVGKHMEDK